MTTNYDEWRKTKSCGQKKRYTKVEAKRIAERRGVDKWRAYRCAWCGAWHIGHLQPGKDDNEWNGPLRFLLWP